MLTQNAEPICKSNQPAETVTISIYLGSVTDKSGDTDRFIERKFERPESRLECSKPSGNLDTSEKLKFGIGIKSVLLYGVRP